MSDEVIVYITTPKGEGSRIAKAIVEKRLAACVNVVGSVKSFYWWKGELVEDEEELLIVKTRGIVLDELIEFVRGIHPYTVPEIIATRITSGNRDYIEWVRDEVKKPGSSVSQTS